MNHQKDQSGFITMIIVIIFILVAVIGLAFMRVSALNK